jgi:hypothetical protein
MRKAAHNPAALQPASRARLSDSASQLKTNHCDGPAVTTSAASSTPAVAVPARAIPPMPRPSQSATIPASPNAGTTSPIAS